MKKKQSHASFYLKNLSLVFAMLVMTSCVSLWEDLPPSSPSGSSGFDRGGGQEYSSPLIPGGESLTSLHFIVRGYEREKLQSISALAEEAYEKVMQDTGLYSFRPRDLYPITVFRSREEYVRESGMPAWSGGGILRRSIVTYEGGHLRGVLAHEISHLIFYEYVGTGTGKSLRWLNEGLAMYEETASLPDDVRREYRQRGWARLNETVLSLQEIIGFVPFSEKDRRVNEWYAHVESLVGFLIERGGRLGFSALLKGIKKPGATFESVLTNAYPGKFQSLQELDKAWRAAVREVHR